MSHDDFQRKADRVRAIPLEVVLTSWAAVRDRSDKSRWHTSRGPLSVTGTKFYNWHTCQGGGGAIDLVVHLSGWDARQAIRWLDGQLDSHAVEHAAPSIHGPFALHSASLAPGDTGPRKPQHTTLLADTEPREPPTPAPLSHPKTSNLSDDPRLLDR